MQDELTGTLRILQQNVNGSSTAQSEILNTNHNTETDIIALQEPYFDFQGMTRASREWIAVYPSNKGKEGKPKVRSMMLVSTKIRSDSREELRTESNDLTIIRFQTNQGKLIVCNIYNDCNNDDAIDELAQICENEEKEDTNMIWVGDFNRHHPMWDNPRHTHLFTNTNISKAEKLIDHTMTFGLFMGLEKEIPTLEHFRSKRVSRPDNVFVSAPLEESIVKCEVIPEKRPSKTDHYPIRTEIIVDKEVTEEQERRNWKKVEWDAFRKELEKRIENVPRRALTNTTEAQTKLDKMYEAINATIENNVPMIKPSKYQRKWWNKDIDNLIKEKTKAQKIANRKRHLPGHEIHGEVRRLRNKVAASIEEAKTKKWADFLEGINNQNVFIASKIVQSEPSDGTGSRILPLKTKDENGTEQEYTTNKSKAERLYQQFFRRKPDSRSLEIPDRPKYKRTFKFEPVKEDQIRRQIENLAPYKAVGPDGIPNILIKECKEILMNHLLTLYRATFKLKWYPDKWKESKTVVIRKPGKGNYNAPKSYRPIALLNTLAKLLSACIAETLSIEGERHGLLPSTQFGGRKGKTATDAILYLTYLIRTALRKKKVVAVRFSDIEAAFPSTSIERLLYDMRTLGVPKQITGWLESKFSGRTTTLTFEDYVSETFKIEHGLDQGCPMSPILFNYYTAMLIRTTKDKERAMATYVDDVFSLTISNTVQEALKKQVSIEEEKEGFGDWKRTHACEVEMSKDGLMIFVPHRSKEKETPLKMGQIEIEPVKQFKYLGAIIDKELKWKEQVQYALGKGTRTVVALKRLGKQTKGIPAEQMQRLYLTTVVPRMMYAAECYVKPAGNLGKTTTDYKGKGSVAIAKKYKQVQRKMAINITGAMNTTAGDIAEIHADLLPIQAMLNWICQRTTIRLATLPKEHPLYAPFRRANRGMVKRYPTQLHFLAQYADIQLEKMETIPFAKKKRQEENLPKIDIIGDRITAINFHKNLRTDVLIHSDGSSIEGGVGAAAVLYRNGKKKATLAYKLGKEKEHTVYEAELVGILLGTYLTRQEKNIKTITIAADNQAALLAPRGVKAKSGNHILEEIMDEIGRIRRRNRNIEITYSWCPGHENIAGNELADELAKAAAGGNVDHPKTIPTALRKGLKSNAAAVKRMKKMNIKERARREWKKSTYIQRIYDTDRRLVEGRSDTYIKIIKGMERRHVSILTQLRTGHAPLNRFLHKIGKSETETCPFCEKAPETVKHFLIDCAEWKEQRKPLEYIDSRKSKETRHLLGNEKFIKEVLKFVDRTGRLKKSHGEADEGNGNGGK